MCDKRDGDALSIGGQLEAIPNQEQSEGKGVCSAPTVAMSKRQARNRTTKNKAKPSATALAERSFELRLLQSLAILSLTNEVCADGVGKSEQCD